MATFYGLKWWGNGKLFAETHMLYTAGGGVIYTPTVDPSLDDPKQLQRILLFKSGAEASKFKYDNLRRFHDDKYVRLPVDIARGIDQINFVTVDINVND